MHNNNNGLDPGADPDVMAKREAPAPVGLLGIEPFYSGSHFTEFSRFHDDDDDDDDNSCDDGHL
jgi:hypothetical protein